MDVGRSDSPQDEDHPGSSRLRRAIPISKKQEVEKNNKRSSKNQVWSKKWLGSYGRKDLLPNREYQLRNIDFN